MKILYFIFFLLVCTSSFSQEEDAWVYFKDKPNATTFLTNPLTILTQRALDRRIAQNIPLDILDVPVFESYINQITSSTGSFGRVVNGHAQAALGKVDRTNFQAEIGCACGQRLREC